MTVDGRFGLSQYIITCIIRVNKKLMQNPREVGEVESDFKSDKNQLAPVEEVSVYVLSPPRTKTLRSHAENRDFHF